MSSYHGLFSSEIKEGTIETVLVPFLLAIYSDILDLQETLKK
jgi:hypothetical protein